MEPLRKYYVKAESFTPVENQARGFGQEETQAAQAHVDRELRRYRQADAPRQQQQFSLKSPVRRPLSRTAALWKSATRMSLE
eukprot:6479259-Amphidinium_carterae.6